MGLGMEIFGWFEWGGGVGRGIDAELAYSENCFLCFHAGGEATSPMYFKAQSTKLSKQDFGVLVGPTQEVGFGDSQNWPTSGAV